MGDRGSRVPANGDFAMVRLEGLGGKWEKGLVSQSGPFGFKATVRDGYAGCGLFLRCEHGKLWRHLDAVDQEICDICGRPISHSNPHYHPTLDQDDPITKRAQQFIERRGDLAPMWMTPDVVVFVKIELERQKIEAT